MNISKDLATTFFETTPVAAFDYVLVPEFLEKKVEILPLNLLACFMYNTRAYKYVINHKSICHSCKIC